MRRILMKRILMRRVPIVSYEEESYIPYSGVEDLTPEFSAVSKSSEIVYYPIKWNPYNETFFNVKQN